MTFYNMTCSSSYIKSQTSLQAINISADSNVE